LPDFPTLNGVPTGRPSGPFAADAPLLVTSYYGHVKGDIGKPFKS